MLYIKHQGLIVGQGQKRCHAKTRILSLSQSQVQSVRRQLEELEQELQKLAGARQL